MAEQEGVQLRPAGPPTRCPFCHADVARDQEPWVACQGCLAPHHASCWRENAACAACGEARCVGEGAALDQARAASPSDATAAGATLEVELRGRRAHIECSPTFALELPPGGAAATFQVRLRNACDQPQRVALRQLPEWLELLDPGEVELEPGKQAIVRARVRVGSVLRRVRWGERARARLELHAGDDRRALELELGLSRAAARARTRRCAAGAILAALLFGLLGGWVAHVRLGRQDALAAHGVTTQAVVTALTPHDHNQMYYAWDVDGVRYHHNDFARGEAVGDRIPITYLPEDPAVAVRGQEFATVSGPGWLAFPMIPLMFIVIVLTLAALRPWLGDGQRPGER